METMCIKPALPPSFVRTSFNEPIKLPLKECTEEDAAVDKCRLLGFTAAKSCHVPKRLLWRTGDQMLVMPRRREISRALHKDAVFTAFEPERTLKFCLLCQPVVEGLRRKSWRVLTSILRVLVPR
jgi:hypothetical protein